MSNTQTHLTTIDEAARRLHARWEAAAEHWRDDVQREFAQHHYAPLQQEHGRMTAKAGALAACPMPGAAYVEIPINSEIECSS